MSVLIVERLRTEWRSWKGQASGKAPRRRATSRRPQVEGLEARALLTGSFTEYPAQATPGQIVKGPDGNLWYTDAEDSRIDEMTPSGKVTVYPISFIHNANGITLGPDGALWFTGQGTIGRITTSGKITEFNFSIVTTAGDIVTGPDGALWFTVSNGEIGRITTTGQVTQYPLPNQAAASPSSITVGPDGALWYTDDQQGLIGRITTSGQVTTYDPHLSSKPRGIVTGPDGNLWVTEEDDAYIARITTSGVATEFPIQAPGGTFGGSSTRIIVGTDGNLYFTESWPPPTSGKVGSIGQITTAGVVQNFSTNITNSSPLGLTMGPGGNIWFADPGTSSIGVMSGVASPSPTPTPTPTPSPSPSPTPTPTPTPSPTPTPTPTPAPFPTSTPTATRPATPKPAPPPRPAPRVQSSSPSSRPLSTRTFLSIKPGSTALGRPVILTARVADLSRPQFNPTGTVAFVAGGARLGTADLQAGKATLTMAALPAGRDRVRVVYLGTNDFSRSRSAVLIESVAARRPDATPGDHSRNIAGTTSHVQLLRRQAAVNAAGGAEIIASLDL
jgi:streptogramin lyase